nr:hypothetical protein [Tanacetum cinerariifolium]GEY20973.1 rhomboid-like protease 5 [Tanacetum cinerariifolium]
MSNGLGTRCKGFSYSLGGGNGWRARRGSLVHKAQDATLVEGVVFVKRCGYFFRNWSSRSQVNSGPLLEFHRNLIIDGKPYSYLNEYPKPFEMPFKNLIFINLPNLSSAIYSAELSSRLRAFLVACPPAALSPHVTDLVVATADFQNDLASWNVNPVKHEFDPSVLFHSYITIWIQDKRSYLLETCKLDKVKWSGVRAQPSSNPVVDEMNERLTETLNDYEVIIRRWPEYTITLENVVADIENAVIKALHKQYADVVATLKETSKFFGLKRTRTHYTAPPELGVLLNSMERMLDVLRQIKRQLKSWGPDQGNVAAGERLSEVTVMLRSKFRKYLQAVVEKLVENTRLQNDTKLKKILEDSKKSVGDSEIRPRMKPLIEQLKNTTNHLHKILETPVFILTCREYWDRMGQDVVSFLAKRKDNRSWYKVSNVAVSILDDTFTSQMQQLLGNRLQEKDIKPPKSIVDVHSML